VTLHGWADIVDGRHDQRSPNTSTRSTPRSSGPRLRGNPGSPGSGANPLWVLVLRVHRLAAPITSNGARYGGCTSWVGYEGLPDDPASLSSETVLSDVAFEAKRKESAKLVAADCWNPRAG